MSKISWMYRNLCNDPSAIVDVIGTSNTDFGSSRLGDNNLKSYWTSVSTGTIVSILFDMGSSVEVDTFIAVHNLPVSETTGTYTLYLMAGNTNPPISSTYILSNPASPGTSMYFIGSTVNYRYYRLLSYGTLFNEQTRINEIFIGKRDVFSVNPEYPFHKKIDSATIVTESEKGQKKVYSKYTRRGWGFSYNSINDALNGTMNKIRKFTSGSYRPFWICLDKDDNPYETFFCRFVKNSFKHSETMVNCHDINFEIEEEL